MYHASTYVVAAETLREKALPRGTMKYPGEAVRETGAEELARSAVGASVAGSAA